MLGFSQSYALGYILGWATNWMFGLGRAATWMLGLGRGLGGMRAQHEDDWGKGWRMPYKSLD